MDTNIEAGVRLGDFKILRLIGAGGDGTVYQAKQISVNRHVALKVIGQSLRHPSEIARFRRQAHAVARMRHSNIAEVYYVGQDGDYCYMAMRLIEGVSLRQFLNRVTVLQAPTPSIDTLFTVREADQPVRTNLRFDVDDPPAEADQASEEPLVSPQALKFAASREYVRKCCTLIQNVATALGYAHRQGVIHRDIKPENIMLDQGGNAHLIDFGIARFLNDVSLSSTGALVGTPRYMSPEQITGRVNIDSRSDIYSLGMVLYELLSIVTPLTSESREGVLRQIVTKAIPPLGWMNSGVPRALEAVIHKAISKDPDERYQSAEGFAADLQAWLGGKPVLATPYRYKFDSREITASRPTRVTLAALLVFANALLVFMVVASLATGNILNKTSPFSINQLTFMFMSVGILLCSTAAGMLNARIISMASAVIMCIGLILFMINYCLIPLYQTEGPSFSTVIFPAFTAFCVLVLYALVSKPTRSWFWQSRLLRKEHKLAARRQRP